MVRIEGLLVASRVNNEGPSEKCPVKTGIRAVSGMSDKKGKCASWGGVFVLGPHVGITYGLDLGASGVSIRLNFGELA